MDQAVPMLGRPKQIRGLREVLKKLRKCIQRIRTWKRSIRSRGATYTPEVTTGGPHKRKEALKSRLIIGKTSFTPTRMKQTSQGGQAGSLAGNANLEIAMVDESPLAVAGVGGGRRPVDPRHVETDK
ncbi:hypothetical protein CRV24_001023 [Beauveria bassiana]|nr:hypothetical protein CRV24_001023 [Beauveria bassiana]KAH8720406.1 hypothetical protein HC256_000801 [Beauveria bassiana]